jgi:hypothetical protein
MLRQETMQTSATTYVPGPHEQLPPPVRAVAPPRAKVALAHGAYLVAMGLWPLLHLRSFEVVTGPKLEGWLTKGMGAMMTNIGATLLYAGKRRDVRPPLRLLGACTALSFAAMDFYYAGIRRRISPVYLGNGAIQLGFAISWLSSEIRERKKKARRPPEAAFA